MDLQHELRRLRLVVAEELLEDERDVGHEVDRIVPDDDDPGPVVLDLVGGARLFDLDFGWSERAHARIVAPAFPFFR